MKRILFICNLYPSLLVNIVVFFVGKYKGGRIWQHMAEKYGHGAFACEVYVN